MRSQLATCLRIFNRLKIEMTTCYEEHVLTPYDVRTVYLTEVLDIELLRYTVKTHGFYPYM